MIELLQVRYFVILAEELNFSRAALRLNISQPPLSRHIQQLEQQLDVLLFERTSRRVTMTPAGQAFLVEARRLLAQTDAAVIATRRAARVVSGKLTVGFVGAATYEVLPQLVKMAQTELPGVEFDLIQLETAEQDEALRTGRIDLGLSRPLSGGPMIDCVRIAHEPMMLAIPQDHPLSIRRRPPAKALEGEPFIMFAPAARHLHDMLTGLLQKAGISPRVVLQMTHSQAILSLVSTGIGLAIVPACARNASFDNIVFRPLARPLACHADMFASWSRENGNPVLRRVREMLPPC
ncbi:LysR substrate-binding domain-containing protein [Frigidibacter sp.]|uniref:LysR substrate-binding domain-containing protein n=1 Tax=Frigidibacter sp. TaxID=2586418 RepID=UPI002732EA46|nr:LysR substrate-binding domain-containing protein [Frigidibacter sp.]MDP3339214.1 LysR substrate-binding domain-containing protein [Frigidibacter sp.]